MLQCTLSRDTVPIVVPMVAANLTSRMKLEPHLVADGCNDRAGRRILEIHPEPVCRDSSQFYGVALGCGILFCSTIGLSAPAYWMVDSYVVCDKTTSGSVTVPPDPSTARRTLESKRGRINDGDMPVTVGRRLPSPRRHRHRHVINQAMRRRRRDFCRPPLFVTVLIVHGPHTASRCTQAPPLPPVPPLL